MQEGAGVRQVIDDELREKGTRLRDLDVRLELGLQDEERGRGGARRDVHLDGGRAGACGRHARRSRRARPGAVARDLARPRDRPGVDSGGRRVRRVRPKVRWGLDELPGLLAELASSGRSSSPARAGNAGRRRRPWSEVPSDRIDEARPHRKEPTACSPWAAGARSTWRRRSRSRPDSRLSPFPPPTRAPSGSELRHPRPTADVKVALRREPGRDRLRARAHARPAERCDRRHVAERARAHG